MIFMQFFTKETLDNMREVNNILTQSEMINDL